MEHYARTLRLNFKKDIPDDLRWFLSLETHPWDESFVKAYEFTRKYFDPEQAIQRLEIWFYHSSFFPGWKGARFKDGQLLVLNGGESDGLVEIAQWLLALQPWIEAEDQQIVFRSIWECHRFEDVIYYDARTDTFKRGVGQRFNMEMDDQKHGGPHHPSRFTKPFEGVNYLDDKLLWNYSDIQRAPYKPAATAPLRSD